MYFDSNVLFCFTAQIENELFYCLEVVGRGKDIYIQ